LGAAALQVRFVTPTADRVAAITATGDSSWRVAFWDWRGPGGLQTTTWRGRQASELAVSWDGRRVAVGLDRRAVVLDAFTGRAVGGTPEEADWIKMVDFSPDGRWVVTAGNDGSARVWAATRWSRRPVGDLLGHVGAVSTARFHPRKQGVVVTAGIDGTARTWQFPLPTLLSRTGASSRMVDMALSRDGRYIVTAEDDGWLRVWRSDTGALQAEHRQKYAVNACFADPCKSSVTFTPDGMQVFTTSISGSRPVLWSWRGNQAPRLLEGSRFLVDSRLLITQAAVSPDKQSVAAGTRMNQVVVWDLGTGKITARLRAGRPEYVVSDVAFVPGTRLIAAGGTDGAVSIWDPRQSDRPLRSLGLGKPRPGVRALDVTRDGRYLVAATEDDTVRVWGISDGRLEQTIAGPWSRIGEVAFSPDGSLLAVGAADGWVHVWSWRDATNLATLRRHDDVVNSVGFTGDGAALVSASDDSTIAAYACTTCGPIDQVVRAAEQREKMNTPSR
jgi:WD40 repeat protein